MRKVSPRRFVLGSRGSALALAQSSQVLEALRQAAPRADLGLRVVKTRGDRDQNTRLNEFPGAGVFVKELQTALLEGRIDIAVHSLKDIPDEETPGLVLASFPPREDARDVFVGRAPFRELPAGSRVGTGSPRRVLQLRRLRPDLEYVSLRGNVDTRLRRVDEGDLAGVVLAAAGLKRLGRAAVITHSFSFAEMVPAVGQAALALECRRDDRAARFLVRRLNDVLTAEAVTWEREFMRLMGGGCRVPMAAHVYPYGEGWRLLAVVGDPRTGRMARLERSAAAGEAAALVEEMARSILEECRAEGIPTPRDSS